MKKTKVFSCIIAALALIMIICSSCGEKEEHIHSDGEWIVDSAATCLEDGQKHLTCAECGEIIEVAPIAATGHVESDDIIEDPLPKCENDVYKRKYCEICGEEVWNTLVYEKCDHSCQTVVDTPSTCTSSGIGHNVCSYCNNVIGEPITLPLKAHSASSWVIDKEATCTEAGVKHNECTVCHQVISSEAIAAKGHLLSAGVPVKNGGKYKLKKECSCGHYEYADIPALTLDVNKTGHSSSVFSGLVMAESISVTPVGNGGYGKKKYKFEAYNGTTRLDHLTVDYSENNQYGISAKTSLENYSIKVYVKDELGSIVTKTVKYQDIVGNQ